MRHFNGGCHNLMSTVEVFHFHQHKNAVELGVFLMMGGERKLKLDFESFGSVFIRSFQLPSQGSKTVISGELSN